MKYIIASKADFKGTSDDDLAGPWSVTEICTELIITRFEILNRFAQGIITENDTIVTVAERECLYTNIFKNVISYDEFKRKNIPHSDVMDLTEIHEFHRLCKSLQYKPTYQFLERDRENIFNIDWSPLTEYDTSRPFIAIVIRTRSAWPEKNMSNQFWLDIIEKLTEHNIPTFIFGKETHTFANTTNIKYVKNFRDWCTLVRSENCVNVSSTMTGGVYPLLLFGNPTTKMTIIDNTGLMAKHGHDPSFYNDCINFAGIEKEFINKIPTTKEYYEAITKDI